MIAMTPWQNRLARDVSTIVICVCILAAAIFVDWGVISDRSRARGFEPTAEMSALKDDLSLTSRAKVIFSASHPAIKDREEFNKACEATNHDISVLGCYDGRHIFIYNISNPELDGIMQSTLAHELLHAVWDRLSDGDRRRLEPELERVYADNLEKLEPRLNLYSEANFYDELHAIIGTEFADLSDKLEKHYAKYFNDQDAIVAFYNQYEVRFRELRDEAQALFAEIEANQELINAKTANYDDAVSELSAAIADFNRRAENGSFTSNAAFNAERATLVAKQQELEQLYNEITELVNATNELIEKYNNNITRTQDLLDSVNSNAPATPEID
jgi:hypothetical protein